MFNEDCTNRLSLPQLFVMKYEKILRKERNSEPVRVKPGMSKLEETEFEKGCFIEGWAKFVTDLKLELGEVLLFWFNVNESTFDILVYGRSCCIKEVSAMADDADEDFIQFMNHCRNVPR